MLILVFKAFCCEREGWLLYFNCDQLLLCSCRCYVPAVGVMCLFFKTSLGDLLFVGMVQEIVRKREGMFAKCVL